MTKRMILILIVLGVVFGGVLGWNAYQRRAREQAMASQKAPPVTVTATEAEATTWQPTLYAVGTVRAVQGVQVPAEVEGRVSAIRFESGDRVKKGQPLVQLDDEADRARLRALRADADLASTEVTRDEQLIAIQAISQDDLDSARSRLEKARALVQEQEVLVAKKAIAAPFTGQAGIRQVDLGQYLSPGDPVVSLQSIDPVYVDFTIPQQNLPQVESGQGVEVRTRTYRDRSFPGRISAVEPELDRGTRSVRLQATLENSEGLLRPGMFVDVAVALPEQQEVVTVPQTAVTYNPYGDSVFVVEESGESEGGQPVLTVHQATVTTGEKRGDQVAIEAGVEAGQRVVTSGQLKLRDRARVLIDNRVTPSNEVSPQPSENH